QGGVAEALARTAELLQDDLDALDALVPPIPMPSRPPRSPSRPASPFPSPPASPPPSRDQQGRTVASRQFGPVDQGEVGGGGADRAEEGLDVGVLAELPKALRTRTLRMWARSLGGDPLSAVHVESLDALVTDWHGQGAV